MNSTIPFQQKAMRKSHFLILVACGLTCAGWAGPQPEVHRRTLHEPTEIQGYPCAKGYAWFFADGRLNRCTVTREVLFGEARVPAGTYIALNPDGTPAFVQMSHNAQILNLTCMGGSWLGSGEGAMVGFYSSGKLKECYLAGDQIVQGIPCMNGGILGDSLGSGAVFHENGKLKSCKLAKDFGGQRKGERFVQAP
jgi:hypothetical protein